MECLVTTTAAPKRSSPNRPATYPGATSPPHYQTGSLFFVDPELKLEVVVAFTENNTEQVETWLKSGGLVKIEALHAQEDTGTLFEALVVSPFILCRPA